MDADLGRPDLERRVRQAAKVTALTERGSLLAAGEGRVGTAADPGGSASTPRSLNALDACHRAREAWQKTQSQLDIFSVLNEQPAPALSHGLLVEGGRTERQGPHGRGSEPARAWLTAAAASHVPAHGGSQGTPPPSTETKQGEVAP